MATELPTTSNLLNELPEDWKSLLNECIAESDLAYIDNLYDSGDVEKVVYPPKNNLFEAFKYFNLSDLKVVILGQDPYHQPGQAHGLAFSVADGAIPRSLGNIYKELRNEYIDVESEQYSHGNLMNWVNQGVLLLNTALTVEASKPNSHTKYWTHITNEIIKKINNNTENVVYLLWGKNAHKKEKFIDKEKNFVYKCNHPSPLSANRGNWFFNSQFLICNKYLEHKGKSGINWL